MGTAHSQQYPELFRWPQLAARLAHEMATRFGEGDVDTFSGVPAFRIKLLRGRKSPWVLVTHPLWEWCDTIPGETNLAKARELANEHGEPLAWDTFNLVRRQVIVRERIREECG